MSEFLEFLSHLSIRDLRDYLAIFLLLLGVGNWIRRRQPYAVTWTELLDEHLFERKGWLTPDLQVNFLQQDVTNPRIVIIKVHNLGQHPVRPSDYAEALKVSFNADTKVLYAHGISNTVDIEGLCLVESNAILLAPKLLNPGDYFVLRILTDAITRTNPRVTGRLAGIIHIEEAGIKIRDRIDYVVLSVLLLGVFSMVWLSFPLFGSDLDKLIAAMIGSGFSYLYEFARTFRYVKENAKIAQLLRESINAFWFTSRISRT